MNTEAMDTPELDLDTATAELPEVATEAQEALLMQQIEQLMMDIDAELATLELPAEEEMAAAKMEGALAA